MKVFFAVLFTVFLSSLLHAQDDERRIRNYLYQHFPAIGQSAAILFYQCKYKPGKNWQYMVACTNIVKEKPVTTLLFAERVQDTVFNIEPFHFSSVASFDHVNIDRSRDRVEELYITTLKDSGNLEERYTGIYSCKNGYVDTLIKFYSFQYKTLQAPWFTYQPGIVVEQEDLCQLTDVNDDGRMDIANRVHRKMYFKDAATDSVSFTHETDYAEYRFQKGKFVKSKPSKKKQDEEE